MRDADLTPTGRELKDPAATLVECVDSDGLKHTVVAFDDPFVKHPFLTTSVDLIMSFMAYPMVTGLVECNAADTKRSRFSYPTGSIWTLKEIVRGFDQVSQTIGMRAALELCYLGGMILHEAGDTGHIQGCFSHGNLTPWRIALKGDGQLQIFGYGLAQVEVQQFLAGELEHLDLDSVRYAPPERLEGQPEQPSSDTYSLAVIAWELITGKPLFDHKKSEDMIQAVKLAEGVQRVGQAKGIPKSVQDTFGSALVYDPDRRLQGAAFIDAMGELLDDPSIQGRTLVEVMDRMGNTKTKSKRKLVKTVETAAFSPSDLKALAKAATDADETDARPQRWKSLRRREPEAPRGARMPPKPVSSKDKPLEPEVEPTTAPPTEEPRRRRRRGAKKEDTPTKDVVEVAVEEQTDETPVDDSPAEPRRRRRRSTAAEPSSESPEPEEAPSPRRRRRSSAAADTPKAEAAEPTPRRRRRRPDPKADTAPADDDTPKAESESPPEEEAAPRRRRRRGDSKPAKEAGGATSPKKDAADTDVAPPKEEAKKDAPAPRRRRRKKK